MKAAIATAALFMACSAPMAAEIEAFKTDDGSDFIVVSGELLPGDEKTFQQIAIPLDRAIVFLDGPGGVIVAGVGIGQTIRIKQFGTAVLPGEACMSACAIAFLGGSSRFVFESAEVGFHAAYEQLPDGTKSESGAANAYVGAYLNSIGLSNDAVIALTTAGPDEFQPLNEVTARQLGIYVEWRSIESIDEPEVAALPKAGSVMSKTKQASRPAQPARSFWSYIPNADLSGGDLAGMPLIVGDQIACQAACDETSGCLAYTYNAPVRACFLKSRTGRGLPYAQAFSAYRSDLVLSPEILGSAGTHGVQFRVSDGFEITGQIAYRYSQATADWCHAECALTNMCQGYAFYQNGECHLKSSIANTRRAPGVLSGRKIN